MARPQGSSSLLGPLWLREEFIVLVQSVHPNHPVAQPLHSVCSLPGSSGLLPFRGARGTSFPSLVIPWQALVLSPVPDNKQASELRTRCLAWAALLGPQSRVIIDPLLINKPEQRLPLGQGLSWCRGCQCHCGQGSQWAWLSVSQGLPVPSPGQGLSIPSPRPGSVHPFSQASHLVSC